jgi:O-antigen/teichoic acid export membrane protein
LIAGSLIGVIGRLMVQNRADTEPLRRTFGHVGRRDLVRTAKDYSDFARLNAPAGLVYAIGQNAPILMFSAIFSPAVAGFFAMANRLSRMPVQIVAMSVRRVFLQKAAAIHNDGRSLRRSFVLTSLGLFALGTAPCALVWFFGEPILTWILGEKWRIAGHYLELIAPWVLMAWATAPCNPVYIVLRRQDRWLTQQLLTTVLRLAGFGIGFVLGWGPEATLQLFIWLTVVSFVIMIVATYRLIGKHGQPGPSSPLVDVGSLAE